MVVEKEAKKFTGLIIKESLRDSKILDDKDIIISKVENWDIGERAADFQPKNWTAVFIEGNKDNIEQVAERISETILPKWYSNLSDDTTEFVIFNKMIFRHCKTRNEDAYEAIKYGISVGIPEHQLDWMK